MSNANSTLMIQIRSVTDAGNVKYKTRTATPEEIKAAHGKCGTCKYIMSPAYDSDLYLHDFYCTYHQMPIDEPLTDYCNHHEPKET